MRTRERAKFPTGKPGGRTASWGRAGWCYGRCACSRRIDLRGGFGVAAPPIAQLRRSSIRKRFRVIPRPGDLRSGSPIRGRTGRGICSIVPTSPYGPRMPNRDPRRRGGPPAPNEREQQAMPRRNSLTSRLLHPLLLISLARGILTVLGRGRAWDEWDERGEVEPATNR